MITLEQEMMLGDIARWTNPRFGYFFRHHSTGGITLVDNSPEQKDIGYFESWEKLAEHLVYEFERWSQHKHDEIAAIARPNEKPAVAHTDYDAPNVNS